MILKDPQVQIAQLIEKYPNLHIEESTDNSVRLLGNIHIYRCANEFTLNKKYDVELVISLAPDTLPIAKDIGNAVDNSFVHRYSNGELCLETGTAIRIRFIDGLDLCAWMNEFVEPYFFSYEYYQRYGEFPFGERPHGCLGTIDTYRELLHCEDPAKLFDLINFAENNTYRGHVPCPCGSGKKLRACHGSYLFPFMTDSRYQAILVTDLSNIHSEILEYEKSRRNHKGRK